MKTLLTNYHILLFIILLGIFSCNNSNQKKNLINSEYGVIPISKNYKTSKLLDSLANIFLDSAKCKDCINELYIDKVYNDYTYFTFIASLGKKDYLTQHMPLFCFSINGKIIYIYTGAETYIIGNQINNELKIMPDTNFIHYLRLQFQIELDTIKLIQVPSEPFCPQIIPAPPEDKTTPKFDPRNDYSN